MSSRESVAGLFFANVSACLGLLAYPLGTQLIFNDGRLSLVAGLAAISAAIIARLSTPPAGPWRDFWRGRGVRAALGFVALGVVLANVWHPAAIAVCGGFGLGACIVIAVFAGERYAVPQFVRLFSLVGLVAGLQAIVTFGVGQWAHYHAVAQRVRTDQEAAARIAAGQTQSAAFTGRTVDLRSCLNVRLNDSFFGDRFYEDSYVRLGVGRHVLGGVPFDVQGIAMLHGKIAAKYGSNFPRRFEVTGLGPCRHIYLLGGVSVENADFEDVAIARVTLRYVDGTSATSDLVLGRNIAGRIGPPNDRLRDPAGEIVWIGANGLTEFVSRQYPGMKLRLSKTSVVNPRPDTAVSALVCESLALDPVPFFAGVTVD